jgi:hypothetical protein
LRDHPESRAAGAIGGVLMLALHVSGFGEVTA